MHRRSDSVLMDTDPANSLRRYCPDQVKGYSAVCGSQPFGAPVLCPEHSIPLPGQAVKRRETSSVSGSISRPRNIPKPLRLYCARISILYKIRRRLFIGAACIVLLVDCIRRKSYRKGLYFTGLALLPALLWFVYMKIGGLYTEGMAITHLFWDGEKAGNIVKGFWTLFSNPVYYGCTFPLFALFVLADIWFIIKGKGNLALLGMIVLSVVFYGLVIYHVDYVWDSIQNVLAYSSKRFFFCFVPMCWYFIATTPIARKGSDYIEKFLSLK